MAIHVTDNDAEDVGSVCPLALDYDTNKSRPLFTKHSVEVKVSNVRQCFDADGKKIQLQLKTQYQST